MFEDDEHSRAIQRFAHPFGSAVASDDDSAKTLTVCVACSLSA